MKNRRPEGRETWHRLLAGDMSSTAAERLSALILASEGYESIDPAHPLGGRDGLKDMVCEKNGIKWIGACFFPTGQQKFQVIKNKFLKDLNGVEKNHAKGMAFITNQKLQLSERKVLNELSSHHVDLFHLDRITGILNTPINYGVRQDFLHIEMTEEEKTSFTAARDKEYLQSLQSMSSYSPNRKNDKDFKQLNHIKYGDVYIADLGNGMGSEAAGTRPVVIVSNYINNKFAPIVNVVPITSQIAKAKLPTHVELGIISTELKESIALVEQIKTVSKMRLGKLLTRLDSEHVEKIKKAIMLQLDCMN